jgi:hypothetical protein
VKYNATKQFLLFLHPVIAIFPFLRRKEEAIAPLHIFIGFNGFKGIASFTMLALNDEKTLYNQNNL